MLDPNHPIAKFARMDGRYHVDAYAFVFDALHHAHTVLNMGKPSTGKKTAGKKAAGKKTVGKGRKGTNPEPPPAEEECHVSGQELCAAIRHLAMEQYGYMAKCVFNRWGVKSTSDFGNIVFNLIELGQMRKTDSDRREDFNDVFDFDRELVEGFRISQSE
ncbi:MAG: hypothetical protein GTO53_10265 [Planctomycetales bacterium]|nr:hypothetical protein [Planctomycetales bacterium]NIM09504.1 hypothetical protein [Planctomycetales bacterium]NIN08992.1 hypothetical protein [Planctomycetales bacterium]NIN78107.1 hypothetical protein [Planctomycetales bacterium]NIO35287.1 hypothetical protein [Planctomycetales bacterium]